MVTVTGIDPAMSVDSFLMVQSVVTAQQPLRSLRRLALGDRHPAILSLSLIHISEPTRPY